MLEAVIFDKDGVLVDTEPVKARSWTKALADFRISVEDTWYSTRIGISGEERQRIIVNQFGVSAEIAREIFERKRQLFKKDSLDSPLRIEGSLKFLEMLRKESSLSLAVASSDYEDSIIQQLTGLGIRDYFQVIVSSASAVPPIKHKPAPDVYLLAAEKLRIAPKNCIAIEDTASGVLSARTAGMYCVGYANSNSGMQDLSQADIVTSDLSQLSVSQIHNLSQ